MSLVQHKSDPQLFNEINTSKMAIIHTFPFLADPCECDPGESIFSDEAVSRGKSVSQLAYARSKE